MKKILLVFLTIILLIGLFSIKQAKCEVIEEETTEYQEQDENLLKNEINDFKNDVAEEIENIKATQTYGIIVFITACVVLIVYTFIFLKKKITALKNSTDKFSNYGDVVEEIGKLTETITAQSDVITDYKEQIKVLKEELDKVKEITTKGFLTNPELVKSGIAREIAKLGE